MEYLGFFIGDSDNQRLLNLKVRDMSQVENVFENVFRSIAGDLNRQVIKTFIPTLNFSFYLVSEDTMAILRGARAQKQLMFLKLGQMSVKRQLETMVGVDYLYLTETSVYGLDNFKVYEKSDFDGLVNLFYQYESDTNRILLNTTLAQGDQVYVDYTYDFIKVILTSLDSKPYKGAYRNMYQVNARFEGV